MANIKKTQLLTLSLVATLLSFTPLLSSSFRSTYIYFIINVLIVVLGAEAGFLSPSSSSSSTTTTTSSSASSKTGLEVENKRSTTTNTKEGTNARVIEEDKNVASEKIAVGKLLQEKFIVCADEVKKMIKKCPSTPSIFFINDDEDEVDDDDDQAQDKVVVDLHQHERDNGDCDDDDDDDDDSDEEKEEELFVKAETFIVNFYKQLKMQREDSWKKIHGLNYENRLLVN